MLSDEPESVGGHFAETLEAARLGDRDALGALWSAFQPMVLRYLRGRGAAEPADLASAVWIDVARGLTRFRGGRRDFVAWLMTIARRRHIDDIRQRVRRPTVAIDAVPEPSVEQPDTADLERALALIRRLPDDMAEAVLLRYVTGLDIAEIATIQGKREGAVRVAIHRGLTRLQHAMEGRRDFR